MSSLIERNREDCEARARNICEFYAKLIRMSDSRAICRAYLPRRAGPVAWLSQSIAEHSFNVAHLAYVVYAELLPLLNDLLIPEWELKRTAIDHDNSEALVGDTIVGFDGVTAERKKEAEENSIRELYKGLVCEKILIENHYLYEKKSRYSDQIIKMIDNLELVLYSQVCVRNEVGLIRFNGFFGDTPTFQVLLDYWHAITGDDRYNEVRKFFDDKGRLIVNDGTLFKYKSPVVNCETLPVSRIMYEHNLVRLEKLFGESAPELVEIFRLVCQVAATFPFEEFNLHNKPPLYSKPK